MTEFKGTQGDWIVDCVDKHGYFITSDSQQNAIAKVYQLFEDDQKAKSNANLVSAAPDLLKLAELVYHSFGGDLVITFTESDVEKFKQTIEKAIGNQL